MDKEELRAKFLQRINAPISDPVDELLTYLNKLWGHGDNDQQVMAWLSSRPPTIGDDRGLGAWEAVLESEVSNDDLRRLLYASGCPSADQLDNGAAKSWLADRLDWVRNAF
jgi:hypothetical protein